MTYSTDAKGTLIVPNADTVTQIDISWRDDVRSLPDLPAATTVDARGCTGLTELTLPAATTVNAGGCTGLTELTLPAATTVNASDCTGLTELSLPAATMVNAIGCTGLTELSLPAATTVYAIGCTGLTELSLPAATMVNASDCTGLTELTLPAATMVYASCTGLTELSLPAATTVDVSGCTGLMDSAWLTEYMAALPELLTAGGRTVAEVAEHWKCHSWDNCPMAVAFGVHKIDDVPEPWRLRAAQFVGLFDSGILPVPTETKP